jgi:hypothetical protein
MGCGELCVFWVLPKYRSGEYRTARSGTAVLPWTTASAAQLSHVATLHMRVADACCWHAHVRWLRPSLPAFPPLPTGESLPFPVEAGGSLLTANYTWLTMAQVSACMHDDGDTEFAQTASPRPARMDAPTVL